jgi:hypothetical protein
MAEALLAAELLLEAMLHVENRGSMSAAAQAYSARERLRQLNHESIERRQDRIALLKLQRWVRKATACSMSKGWDTESVERAVNEFREATLRDCAQQGYALGTPESVNADPPRLDPRHEAAYSSFQLAETSNQRVLTLKAAFKWLKENGAADYPLPSFETWARYVRKGREFYGTQKNRPRAGRTARSAVRPKEIERRSDEE